MISWDTAPEELTANDLASLFGSLPRTIRRRFRKLAYRYGERELRYSKKDVLSWVEKQKVQAADVIE